ncbi:unnamed protein product [Paramecium sonneborni]|uniref:Protein kinase domain-containing protein n=1 Tax=Paramecium sonneborni TaxID=65129 RepID=A0A8S1N8P6_9CILI|nr:unnamed protein product [Paramecium sonneborni]
MANQRQIRNKDQTQKSTKALSKTMQPNKSKISINNFKKIKKLGQGTYGSVFLVEYQSKSFDMKEIDKSSIQKQISKIHIESKRQFYNNIKDDKYLYLIANFVKLGELFFHLKKSRSSLEVWMFNQPKYSLPQMIFLIEYHIQRSKTRKHSP